MATATPFVSLSPLTVAIRLDAYGHCAVIDATDLPAVWSHAHLWFYLRSRIALTSYAVAITRHDPAAMPRVTSTLLHRLILSLWTDGTERIGHHRNGVGLDCRRSNLHPCATQREHARIHRYPTDPIAPILTHDGTRLTFDYTGLLVPIGKVSQSLLAARQPLLNCFEVIHHSEESKTQSAFLLSQSRKEPLHA